MEDYKSTVSAWELPIVEENEDSHEQDFLKELSGIVPNPKRAEVRKILDGKKPYSESLSPEEVTLFHLLMGNFIGTGAQRGSITRILNTLKERYVPEPNTALETDLRNKVISMGLPFK